MNQNNSEAPYRTGSLPRSAPLAMAYVPMQRSVQPSYEAPMALSRGTLFPGLDLPFMGVVNTGTAPTPQRELMAISFVCDELTLYLDTHSEDTEAFELLQTMLALKEEAHERFVRRCSPLTHDDLRQATSYTWLNDPWPWDYRPARED